MENIKSGVGEKLDEEEEQVSFFNIFFNVLHITIEILNAPYKGPVIDCWLYLYVCK